MSDPQCSFYVRSPVESGGYYYDHVSVGGYQADGCLWTSHPPQVGDIIHLWDQNTKSGGQYRVIERAWMHSSYGSANWPYGQAEPTGGPMLDVIVEAAEGLFRDQVRRPEAEGDGS